MNRIQQSITSSDLTSGIATVAANPELTLLRTDDAFHKLLGISQEDCRTCGDSLCAVLGPELCVPIHQLLTDTQPDCAAREISWYAADTQPQHEDAPHDAATRLHLSFLRLDGQLHAEKYPVYTIVFTDISSRYIDHSNITSEEKNYRRILQNNYTAIYEVDLTARSYRIIHNDPCRAALRRYDGDATDMSFPLPVLHIHPDDRELYLRHYDIDTIRDAIASGEELSAEYRVYNKNGQYIWTASLILSMLGDSNRTLVLCRDVNQQKRLNERQRLEEQRFNAALRSIYTEIYEIDLLANVPRLLFSVSDTLIPLDSDKTADIYKIAATLVHCDDGDRMVNTLCGGNVRKCFADGQYEVPEEYRRLGYDGNYHWISSSLVPLRSSVEEEPWSGLLLVRDISERKEQEQQQRISEQYDLALRNIYDELYELNVTRNSYRIVYHVQGKYVAPAEEGVLSEAIEEIYATMIHPDDRERFLAFFNIDTLHASFASGREYLIGEFRKLWQDGTFHWASLTMFPVGASASDEIYLVFIMDIGEKKRIEELTQQNLLLEHQRLADERYRIIINQTDTLVFEWRRDNDFRFISPEIPRRFAGNYSGRDLMAVWRDDDVVHQEDQTLMTYFLDKVLAGSPYTEMTARFRTRAGQHIWCKVALTCLLNKNGTPKRYIGTLNNVDEATRSTLALKYRAEFDTLTGIYNMQTFYTKAAQAIREHPEHRYSIIRIDIDRFKVINDLYGIDEGDKLLCAIARLLKVYCVTDEIYGRISGDIFCVCSTLTKTEILRSIELLTEELSTYPLPYRIMPSFGICTVDNRDTPVNILCDWANLALRTIKGSYLTNYAFYDEKLRQRILDDKKIESEMHNALKNGEFVMFLQPNVAISTSEIVGAEALVRWVHPENGIIAPDTFVPLFEKNGFILQLDEYIWDQACRTLRTWIDSGRTPVPLSVNVSRMHIHDVHFCDKLLQLVTKYSLSPRLIKLELTESAFLENETGLLAAMANLQAHDFLFSMDDFGSGYSSLNMLKSLPINIIKIDRIFLNEVVATERGKTIIRHVIAMARQMDIAVIAEGVETLEHALFLIEAGCPLAQGYFYSPALSVSAFEELAYGAQEPPFPLPREIQAVLSGGTLSR